MKTNAKKTVSVMVGGKVVATGTLKKRKTHDYWHGEATETVVLTKEGDVAAFLGLDGAWYADACGARLGGELEAPCEIVAA